MLAETGPGEAASEEVTLPAETTGNEPKHSVSASVCTGACGNNVAASISPCASRHPGHNPWRGSGGMALPQRGQRRGSLMVSPVGPASGAGPQQALGILRPML